MGLVPECSTPERNPNPRSGSGQRSPGRGEGAFVLPLPVEAYVVRVPRTPPPSVRDPRHGVARRTPEQGISFRLPTRAYGYAVLGAVFSWVIALWVVLG